MHCNRFHIPLLIVSCWLGILTGCQLLAPYKGPITPTPDQWKGSYDAPDAGQPVIPMKWKGEPIQDRDHSSSADKICSSGEDDGIEEENQEPCFEEIYQQLCNWWEIFRDPKLNQLEEQALNSSYTLWAALERVIQARDQARINFAPLMPSVNFNPSFLRWGELYLDPFAGPLGGSGCGTGTTPSMSSSGIPGSSSAINTGAAATTPTLPLTYRFVNTQYLLPLTLNYEVDLWSQLNNAYYASLIRAQAASQAYLSVLLSLTADIASNYFQLRDLDAQQEVIQGNIRVRQEAVDINSARFKAGLVPYLDVSRAQLVLAQAHADSDNVRRLRGLQENIIATLVGVPASVFSIEYNPIQIPPPVVPTGIPSELLCRRPDIAEAERNLAAAYRDIGVAYANFFPSLNLNAELGFQGPFLHNLLSWKARFWQVGWNVMQVVFDGGRNQANLEYYRSRFREALANYEQQVLTAFQDVEDALVNLRENAVRAQDLAVAVQAAEETLELSQLRYNRGLTNYLDVVDAERSLLETEQTSVIVLGDRYAATVALIRALGGGWGPCDCSSSEEN